jgi:hypothetical protein
MIDRMSPKELNVLHGERVAIHQLLKETSDALPEQFADLRDRIDLLFARIDRAGGQLAAMVPDEKNRC